MNKIVRIALIGSVFLSIATTLYFYQNRAHFGKIEVYTGDSFRIPHDCKNLALLGCTPHPTQYLKEHNGNFAALQSIELDAFLDIDYLRDSFERTFVLCKEQNVDHLLIAYLPIYYIGMREILGSQFVGGCNLFLKRIIKYIASLIEETSSSVGFKGGITLIMPSSYQLSRVPQKLAGVDDRIRYLIKQFPALKNISESDLQTITIINNKESAEDDMLINYLKYEYLYEKPIAYTKYNTGKERFHAPKSNIKKI